MLRDNRLPFSQITSRMRYSWLHHLTAMGIRGIGLVAKFLLVLSLVRYFKPNELGLYGIITAMVAYALFFLGLEYYNHVSRALVDASPTRQALIIRDQMVLYAIVYLLLTPFFYALFYYQALPKTFMALFFLLIAVEHASNECMRILIALSRPYLANIVYFIRQGAWILVLLPLFYISPVSRSVHAIYISWIIGASLSIGVAGIALWHLPWRATRHHAVDWSELRRGLRASRPFMLSSFCALSLLYVERFFIDYYVGLDAVGIYTFYAGLSVTLHNLINTGVSKMRLSALLRAWKQNNPTAFYDETRRMLKETIGFVLAFVALSIALIHPFVQCMNKSAYLSHLPVFYLLLFGAACRSIADVPLYTLYAQHRDRLLLLINVSSFCTLLLGNALFVPHYGLIAAAGSSAIASMGLLIYASSKMVQRMPTPHLQS